MKQATRVRVYTRGIILVIHAKLYYSRVPIMKLASLHARGCKLAAGTYRIYSIPSHRNETKSLGISIACSLLLYDEVVLL